MRDDSDATLDGWAAWMRASGSSPATVRTRVAGVKAMRNHLDVDPREVTTMQVVTWLGAHDQAWTRCTYHATVRAWCAWLVTVGERPDDPTVTIPAARTPRSSPRPVDSEALARVMAAPGSLRAAPYLVLAAYAGLRVHEIAKVRGEDTDGATLWVCGKGGDTATLPLHPTVERLVRSMPARGWWFPGACDGHVWPRAVSATIRKALARHGVTATAHQVRHAYATELLRGGASIRTVQELMRHRSLASTAIYTGVSELDKRSALARLPWSA